MASEKPAEMKKARIGMTRSEAIEILKRGESILLTGYNDNLPITRESQLPSASEFVAGDPAKAEASLQDIDAQLQKLQQERARIVAEKESPAGGEEGPQKPARDVEGEGGPEGQAEGQDAQDGPQEAAQEEGEPPAHEEGPLSRRHRRGR